LPSSSSRATGGLGPAAAKKKKGDTYFISRGKKIPGGEREERKISGGKRGIHTEEAPYLIKQGKCSSFHPSEKEGKKECSSIHSGKEGGGGSFHHPSCERRGGGEGGKGRFNPFAHPRKEKKKKGEPLRVRTKSEGEKKKRGREKVGTPDISHPSHERGWARNRPAQKMRRGGKTKGPGLPSA